MGAAGLKINIAFLAGDFIFILMAMKINLLVGPSLAAEMAASYSGGGCGLRLWRTLGRG